MGGLPKYRDLPAMPGAPAGSSWGVWGEGDELGCMNLMTAERMLAARECIRAGKWFALNLRIDRPDPPLYGRAAVKHTILGAGSNGRDDFLDAFNPQSSSQWDSLRHIRHPEHGFYNGTPDEAIVSGDSGRLGVDTLARRGIAGRAVLLDVARHRLVDCSGRDTISVADLEACRKAQGVEVKAGDVLLIRTGWLGWYEGAPAEKRAEMADRNRLMAPGLAATEDMAEYLWDSHVAAVASDNPALEAWPPLGETGGFLHHRLIPLLGMPIGELWWLDDLAADCASDGVYACFFTSAPLNVPGGVGSPPNAIAVK